MPRLTRWFVRAALVNLLVGLGLWLVPSAQPIVEVPGWMVAATPAFLHLITVGWLTQLIFGIGHWMFPKASLDRPRGNERIMWFVFFALNLGLALRVLGEPLLAQQNGWLPGLVLVASASLQWLAVAGFVVNSWGRVKGR